MHNTERTYSLLTLYALAFTVVAALAALVHGLGAAKLAW